MFAQEDREMRTRIIERIDRRKSFINAERKWELTSRDDDH